MPKEIFPSSYICDCGVESHHFENTIREMKNISQNKRQVLNADDGEHAIIFQYGKFVAMYCPKVQKEIVANKNSQQKNRANREYSVRNGTKLRAFSNDNRPFEARDKFYDHFERHF